MLSTELIPIREEVKTPHQSHNDLTPSKGIEDGRLRDQPILVRSKIPIHDLKSHQNGRRPSDGSYSSS